MFGTLVALATAWIKKAAHEENDPDNTVPSTAFLLNGVSGRDNCFWSCLK